MDAMRGGGGSALGSLPPNAPIGQFLGRDRLPPTPGPSWQPAGPAPPIYGGTPPGAGGGIPTPPIYGGGGMGGGSAIGGGPTVMPAVPGRPSTMPLGGTAAGAGAGNVPGSASPTSGPSVGGGGVGGLGAPTGPRMPPPTPASPGAPIVGAAAMKPRGAPPILAPGANPNQGSAASPFSIPPRSAKLGGA